MGTQVDEAVWSVGDWRSRAGGSLEDFLLAPGLSTGAGQCASLALGECRPRMTRDGTADATLLVINMSCKVDLAKTSFL